MNVDNRDMDLGLALGTTNKCVKTRWTDSSGAGVNACSRVDMTFVASDPLMELVWYPQNGLTLKCAGSNLADKKLSLQWYVEPTNIVCSPSLSIRSRGIKDKKSISEGNAGASRAAHHVDSEVARSASLAKSRGRSAGPFFGSSHGHTGGAMKESVEHSKEKDCCRENENNQICSSNKKDSRNTDETSEVVVGQVDQRTADLLPLLTNEPIHGKEETELFLEKFKEEGIGIGDGETEGIGKDCQRLGLDISLSSKNHTVKQFETLNISLQNVPSSQRRIRELSLVVKESKDIMNVDGCTCAPDLDRLEATAENDIKYLITKDACEPSEKRAERGKSVQAEASSDNSRIRLYHRKGKMKEKYSSDREVKERASKDMDDSHGSMESCNSANLSSKGNRRWSFDQQFISKRMKNQIHESPSTSLVKQDSSFMNWISNMVKGIGKSNEEEGCSLPSTTDFPNHEHDGGDQKISLCNKTRDAGSRKMGFGAIFQSLYCPVTKVDETRSPIENYVVAGSKELILADKSCTNNVTPILNNSCNGSAYGNVDGPSILLKSKILSNLVCTEAKNVLSSSDSSWGQKKNASARGNSFDPSAEGRPINIMGNTSNPPGSLWITRYSPKTPSSMSDLDLCNQKSVEGSKSSTEKVNVVGKELGNCAPNTQSSIFSRKLGVEKYKKTVIQKPSESLKSPEEMASLFARRLDALKHISSIAVKDDASHIRNCLFCGKGGHKLQDCSDIAETELEGLLRNSNLYDAAEETPCFCIKCFQPNHWAATCPLSGKVQRGIGNKRCFSIFEAKESQLNSDGICSKRHMVDLDHTSGVSRNPEAFSEKGILNLDEVQKHFAPTTKDNKLIDKQLTPWCNIAVKQISEAPKGIYDAVRMLRLSRTDILKWMSGHISVSNMDGYFLRLRLGKWKEGLGGAGYYVACITGSPREKALKSSKCAICVSIGGIECVVESKYVSNHDFEEDELIAWWQKCIGNKECPKEADLQFRLKEREKLRF